MPPQNNIPTISWARSQFRLSPNNKRFICGLYSKAACRPRARKGKTRATVTLTGGECQCAAVARALITRPRLLLELNAEEQVTLILATHALDLAARMKRRFQLLNGRLA